MKVAEKEGDSPVGPCGRGGGGLQRGGGGALRGQPLLTMRGGRGGAWVPGGTATETERERGELLDLVRDGIETRARSNKKRTREEEVEEARLTPQPPEAMTI